MRLVTLGIHGAITLLSVMTLGVSAVGQTACPGSNRACPEGMYCSRIAAGRCVPVGRVDCGSYSCEPSERCGAGNRCERSQTDVEKYGAIAINEVITKSIIGTNLESAEAAESGTMAECGEGCRIVAVIPPHSCGAIAWGNVAGWGAARAPDALDAAKVALSICLQHDPTRVCRNPLVRCND